MDTNPITLKDALAKEGYGPLFVECKIVHVLRIGFHTLNVLANA